MNAVISDHDEGSNTMLLVIKNRKQASVTNILRLRVFWRKSVGVRVGLGRKGK